MRQPRHQTQLKARLLETINTTTDVNTLKRTLGAVYHYRRKDTLTFSQFQDLLEAGERAKVRLGVVDVKGGA
jgi:hypothetical protein